MHDILFSLKAGLSDTAAIADKISGYTRDCKILLMHGDLGSGKTTLTKLLLKKWGIATEVTSPTFNIVNEYRNEQQEVFYHFDLYRIRHIEELTEIGFFDYIDSGNMCVIEWPEIAEQLIQEPLLELSITHQDEGRLYDLAKRG